MRFSPLLNNDTEHLGERAVLLLGSFDYFLGCLFRHLYLHTFAPAVEDRAPVEHWAKMLDASPLQIIEQANVAYLHPRDTAATLFVELF